MKLEKLEKQLKGHIIWYTRSYVEKLEILRIQKGHMIAYVKLQMHDEFVHEKPKYFTMAYMTMEYMIQEPQDKKKSDNIINQ